jgi:LysM repeat protein
MKRLVLTTLLGLGIQWLFAQDNLYIKVDPTCMDRFEYHINGESKGVEYISYRIRQGDKNFLFLEVGAEATGYQLSAPPVVDCRTLSLSSSFVDRVNRRELNLFIVRKDEIGYNISPVNLATMSSFTNNVVKYRTYDTDFQADVNNVSTQSNLTNLDATNEIYSGGVGVNACLKEYYFHKVSKESCKPAIGLVYVPEIGVVKEITGKSNMSAYESTLNLVRINDVSFETYLANICESNQSPITMSEQYAVPDAEVVSANSEQFSSSSDVSSVPTSFEATSDRFTSDGNIVSNNEIESKSINLTSDKTVAAPVIKVKAKKEVPASSATSYTATTSTFTPSTDIAKPIIAVSPVTIKCNEVATKDFHVVQQGESMYGIARRYGVRVDQLQEWNNMNQTTLISPCSKLRVLPETSVSIPTEQPKPFETTDLLVAKGGDIENIPAWKNNKTKIHEVKKGDTYYGLAQKYGYTLDRFLEMNGIIDENSIKIGQKLQVSDCVCPADSKLSTAPKSYETNTLTTKGGSISPIKNTENKGKKEEQKVSKTPPINFKRQTVHIVSEDETIKSIAAKYGLSTEILAQINYLEANEILIPKQHLFVD